jgi:hypothetical protein
MEIKLVNKAMRAATIITGGRIWYILIPFAFKARISESLDSLAKPIVTPIMAAIGIEYRKIFGKR